VSALLVALSEGIVTFAHRCSEAAADYERHRAERELPR